MKTISLEQTRATLDQIARGEAVEPVIVVVDGRPVAALVPLDELDLENAALMSNPAFLQMLEQSRRQVQQTGGLSVDEVRRQLDVPARRSAG